MIIVLDLVMFQKMNKSIDETRDHTNNNNILTNSLLIIQQIKSSIIHSHCISYVQQNQQKA